MTLKDNPGRGVLVWAGLLRQSAIAKPKDAIEVSDYVRRQIVSFATWPDVWAYYEADPDFASLLPSLRDEVDKRIASGENAPGPQR